MTGLLRIRGRIELAQFWPKGSSDADTSKVKVSVDADSFAFAANGKTFRKTTVFKNASVIGASRKPVIDKNNKVTVRLQGIDAPELHYKAAPLKGNRPGVSATKRQAYNDVNDERRQFWSESATVALAKKLAQYGSSTIACEVVSFVDAPKEVVDTYGRIIGNVRVGRGFSTDINLWLAREGWAFPTFYSSMTTEEIEALLAAMKTGKKKGRVWAAYSGKTNRFRKSLLYRRSGPIDAAGDRQSPVLMPKIYRRQVGYEMEKAANVFRGSFKEFLERSPDQCFETKEFIRSGVHVAQTRQLADFLDGATFERQPQELVFKEKFSTVVRPNGKEIEHF